jgi:mutator protein MutT
MRKTTLLYLRRGDQILLALKKRGFGAGKWNAPGGKAEPGETIEATAIRECQEEVCVIPRNLRLLGDIEFYMPSMPGFAGHHIFVYTADEWDGEPAETEEMRPEWFHVTKIPYEQMWPADRRWLPDALSLNGTYFRGKVVQGADDVILEYDIHPADPPTENTENFAA